MSIIAMDYPRRQRLKLFGMARVIRMQEDPTFVSSLEVNGEYAVVEAAFVVTVTAFDWNCPQHIPQRFTLAQVEQRIAPLRDRVRELECQVAAATISGYDATTSDAGPAAQS